MATRPMSSWQDLLQDSPIAWLLEKENPSVRYFTLRDLLDLSIGDSQVKVAKEAIPASNIVAKILSKQKTEGYWEDPNSPYLPKYKSTYWQVMILAQFGDGHERQKSSESLRVHFKPTT